MDDFNRKMGDTITALRKNRGYTQEELANRLDITTQAVSKWECDQAYPDITTLPRLADLFGVTIDSLFGRGPEDVVRPNKSLPWPNDRREFHAVLYRGHELLEHAEGLVLNLEDGIEGNLSASGDVNCGTVEGHVNAGGSITCDGIEGNVNAGGSITCDGVEGNVNAGGSVTCDSVEGNVSAGGTVTCDSVEGNVSAGGTVTCENVEGDVSAGYSVTCEEVQGDVRAHGGTVICHGDIQGDVEALTVMRNE